MPYQEPLMQRSRQSVIVESLLFLLIDIVAIVGNLFVIAAISRNTRLRSTTHWHIVSLAIFDWFMAVTCMPLTLGAAITGQWVYGKTICQIQGQVINIWTAYSLMIVSVTAVNRYYRVVRPVRYRKIFTKKFALLVAIASFAVSTAMSLGMVFLAKGWFQFGPHLFCIPAFPDPFTQRMVLLPCFLTFIIIPLAVVLLSYFKVYRAVHQHTVLVGPSLRGAQFPRQDHGLPPCRVEDIRITKMIFAIVLVFCILWVPVCVIGVLYVCGFSLPRWVHLMYDYLLFITAATNPLIYGLLNKAFRDEYAKILRWRDSNI